MATTPADDEAAPGTRPPSEFAVHEPRLRRLAALPPDDPERAELRDRLILAFLPIGERIVTRYGAVWPGSREDLRQVAAVGVINAVDRWDPERARGDVLTYIVPSIRGEVLRYIRDRTWAVHVPRRIKEMTVSIHHATVRLGNRLGRAPRPSELARHLGADLEDVLEALAVEESRHPVPLDLPGDGDGDGGGLLGRLGRPDRDLQAVDDVVTVRELMRRLPDRERRIIELRFFHDRTQSQIAEELGISQMHVSRLLARTLDALRGDLLADRPALD